MSELLSARLWHHRGYRSGFQPSYAINHATWGDAPGWYKPRFQRSHGASIRVAALLLLIALTQAFALTPTFAKTRDYSAKAQQHDTKTPQHIVKVRIINAKTNHPVTDEKLNVALRVDQIGSVAMPTDKNGIIEVKTGNATTIRILSNMYADCRSRGELYTDYSINEIRNNGITTGNLCSNAKPKAKPGELILFEIPKIDIPKYPQLPASHAPIIPVEPKEKP